MKIDVQSAWGKVVEFARNLVEEKDSIRGKYFSNGGGFNNNSWIYHLAEETHKNSGQYEIFYVTQSSFMPMSGRGVLVDAIPMKTLLDEGMTYSAAAARSRIDQLDEELEAKRAKFEPGALRKN